MDPREKQKRMEEIQKSGAYMDAFSKLVSGGKSGYKTVFEKPQNLKDKCNCGKLLEGSEKFCPECGTKLETENTNTPDNSKNQTDTN